MMRKLTLFLFLFLNSFLVESQSLGGFPIYDHLVSAVHPYGCSSAYVARPPNDSTWVNFNHGDIMTGLFGSIWADIPGDDLLLETSYHPDNYSVRLKLTSGLYSAPHSVVVSNWIQITDTPWVHLFTGCNVGTYAPQRYILPLDFSADFGLTASDFVTGIEITFITTVGAPDFSGAYIIQNQPCQLNLGNDTTLCQGSLLTLNATFPNSSYQWQNNSTNPTLTISQPGTYWVTVTNSVCTVTDTINVSYTPAPAIFIGNDTTLCQGSNLLLSAMTPNATYQWQNSSSLPMFLVTQQGTYWVKVTVNNCSSTDSIQVIISPPPQFSLGQDTSLCQGELMTLNPTTANASYQWQNNSADSTFTVSQAGLYWVIVSVNNCTSTDTIQVNYNPRPVFNLGNDTTLCQGGSLMLNATTSNATYQWQNNSGAPQFQVTQQGTYWVKVTVNSCSTLDTIQVNFSTPPQFSLGQDTSLCQGELMILNPSTTNATYQWQNNSSTSSFTVSQTGLYWVIVTANNCTSTDSIQVNYNPQPVFNLGNDTSLCAGSNLLLNVAHSNATYTWQDLSTLPSLNVTQAGTYWVTVAINNCKASDTLNVTYQPNPIVDLGPDTTLCPGDTISLNPIQPNASYLWQNNSVNSTQIVIQQGIYWVMVTTNLCTTVDSIIINYTPSPSLSFGNDTTICMETQFLLNATTPNSTYLWQDNSTQPTFTVTQQGTYWVNISNSCWTHTSSVNVTEYNCNCTFYISNTFTPNGDDVNELFTPISDCVISNYHFMIFNRWGDLIYETKNFLESWDGKYQGSLAPIGTYIYIINYQFENEIFNKTTKGLVNLIR